MGEGVNLGPEIHIGTFENVDDPFIDEKSRDSEKTRIYSYMVLYTVPVYSNFSQSIFPR